jgi:DNA uptake protein ComE-like DNA-binding protein
MRHATLLTLALLVLGLALLPSDGAAQQTPAVPKAGAVQQAIKQIDLNKATDAQLKSLPGLNSDDLVKKIKAARPFKQVEDPKTVVPEPVFEQVKNLVMVTP